MPRASPPSKAKAGSSCSPSVSEKLDDDDVSEIKEAFELFSSDAGTIDGKELMVAMRALGFMVRRPEVRQIMQEHDSEKSGRIDFEGFLDVMKEKLEGRSLDDEIEKGFELFDVDGTGSISIQNLRQIADELGEDIDNSELEAMLAEFDADEDGQINLFEFADIMRKGEV